eukprot:1113347-Prymnesium_polylepis.1
MASSQVEAAADAASGANRMQVVSVADSGGSRRRVLTINSRPAISGGLRATDAVAAAARGSVAAAGGTPAAVCA